MRPRTSVSAFARICALAALIAFALGGSAANAAIVGPNLVIDGDAETGFAAWTPTGGSNGNLQVHAYNDGGYPTNPGNLVTGGSFDGGDNLFSGTGGGTGVTIVEQAITLSGPDAAAVLAGGVRSSLSAFIGGFATQADNLRLEAIWYDSLNAPVLTQTLAPVTPADRLNRTGFLPRESSAIIPTTATHAVITVTVTHLEGGANDGYVDNIELHLVTGAPPILRKAFAAPTTAPGTPITLTFTVDNSATPSPQTGWTFLDDLPAGLVVAQPDNAATTCPNGEVVAPAGAISISASGDVGASTSCTITVDVVSSSLGATYENGPDNITAIGLTEPATPATLLIAPPPNAHPPLQTCTPTQIRATERYWYFGNQAAFDFGLTGTTLTQLTPSGHNSQEGTTVVTDTAGALQFWSNAGSIFDRNSDLMSNGGGLLGNPSATQTVAAFPSIGHPGTYFVVTTSAISTTPGTLTYSVVDMSLNGGLGAVVAGKKNITLGVTGTASEAITALPNADGTGFWVLTYTYNSPNVLAYAFDADGPVTGTPVTSVMPDTNFNGFGSLSASPDLSQIVMMAGLSNAAGRMRMLYLDAQTGVVTQTASWVLDTANGNSGYYADFSPSGDYVYATRIFGTGGLYRYDVATTATSPAIKASEQYIGAIGTNGGAVRRGPDGRMYVANQNSDFLSVVTNPDGPVPTLAPSSLQLAGAASSSFGLPQTVTGCPRAEPHVTGTKDVANVTDPGQPAEPGDVLQYDIAYSNDGGPSDEFVITDPIPAGTTYLANSLQMVSGAPAPSPGPRTDAAADDNAEYDAGATLVRFRVGTGADQTTGGALNAGDTVGVRFRVTVGATAPGLAISNTARATFHSPTLDEDYTEDTPPETLTFDPPPPVVTISGPAPGTQLPTGGGAVIDFDCATAAPPATCGATVTRPDGTVVPIVDGGPLPTDVPGVYTITVTSVDDEGQITTVTRTYEVFGPPSVTITGPVDGGEIAQGTPLTALFSCAAPAGVASCVATYPNGGSIDTSKPGTYTFTVTVVDKLGRTVSKTITYTIKPAAAVDRKTANELLLECSGTDPVLIDVRQVGNRVRFQGATGRAKAGDQIPIRLRATGQVVSRAVVQPNGFFESTGPLPPRSIRNTNQARYRAEFGDRTSLDLKLMRRLDATGLTAGRTRITIRGTVSKPLADPIRKVFVRQRTVCGGKGKIVGSVRPGPSGRFSVSFPRPTGVDSAIYRLETRVRKHTKPRKRPKTYPTYTLVRGVNLF